jgi:hypothetical protein
VRSDRRDDLHLHQTMSTPHRGRGRIFKRRSRLTGEELSTWCLAYHVDGKERRKSSHSTDYEDAQRLMTNDCMRSMKGPTPRPSGNDYRSRQSSTT